MYCPYCATENLDSSTACINCGKNLLTIKNESDCVCSDCGKDIPVDALNCWNCGASLEQADSNESEYVCSDCGYDIKVDDLYCGKCGASLEQINDKATITSTEIIIPPKSRSLKANKKIVDESLCKICSNHFSFGEDIKFCEKCQSFYHQKCWEHAGGCNQSTCREEMKPCPFCGEEIKKTALKCKHCGEYIDASLRDKQQMPKGKLKLASEALTYAIIGLFCFGFVLGPIAISKGNKAKKIIESEPGWEGGGKANAAIILGWIEIVLSVIYFLTIISR